MEDESQPVNEEPKATENEELKSEKVLASTPEVRKETGSSEPQVEICDPEPNVGPNAVADEKKKSQLENMKDEKQKNNFTKEQPTNLVIENNSAIVSNEDDGAFQISDKMVAKLMFRMRSGKPLWDNDIEVETDEVVSKPKKLNKNSRAVKRAKEERKKKAEKEKELQVEQAKKAEEMQMKPALKQTRVGPVRPVKRATSALVAFAKKQRSS